MSVCSTCVQASLQLVVRAQLMLSLQAACSQDTISVCDLQAKSMLNAVNSLPQLEQAVKLIARVPQAKWAIDLHKIASEPF